MLDNIQVGGFRWHEPHHFAKSHQPPIVLADVARALNDGRAAEFLPVQKAIVPPIVEIDGRRSDGHGLA